jgi:hypothetical protein
MRTRLRSRLSLLFMAFALVLAVPAVALASDVSSAVVDTESPFGSVSLSPGNSGNITINATVSGRQGGTSTFKVNRDWTLSGGTFTGSNPTTITVPARPSGAPSQTFPIAGTVSVDSGQAPGTFNLSVPAFGVTNTTTPNLAVGTASTYSVTVTNPPDPCAGVENPDAPDITANPNTANGNGGWYTSVPSVSAASATSGATITYATQELGGTKSAYSSTPPTLGEGTTEVFAKATSATCGRVSESSRVFMVDTVAPDVNPASVVNNVWRNSSLSQDFTSSDSTSGLADTAHDASFTLTAANESSNSSTPTVDSRTVYDVAGNSTTRSVSAKIDLTDPVISGADIIQTAWRNSPLTANFTASDALSGLANPLDGTFTLATSGDSPNATTPVTDSKTISDNAGNSDTRTISAFVDTGDPTISGSASPAPNANGWNKTNVDVSFTCGDSLSGTASCGPDQTLQSEGSGQSASGTATDNAGNTASTTVNNINIDKTNPSVSLVGGPANNGSYYFSLVPSAPTCDASDDLSGLAGLCSVTGYSNAVGSHTVTATANDKAGNSNSASNNYSVLGWTFNGFYQPVDMSGTLNTIKGGSTVPIKFELFAGNTEMSDPDNVKSLQYAKVNCDGSAPTDAIEMVATGSTQLRYDTTAGQFVYNWKTPTGAGTCYKATITAQDGSAKSALFKLK